MSSAGDKRGSARKPRAFRLEETIVTSAPTSFGAPFETPFEAPWTDSVAEGGAKTPPMGDAQPAGSAASRRGWGWGGLLVSALFGLVTLAAGLWLAALIENLFVRHDWIGWTAVGLLGLAALSALALALREIVGIARLGRLRRIRQGAEEAFRQEDEPLARVTVSRLGGLFRHRADLAWQRARFDEHGGDIMNAREVLRLADRELMAPLDARARTLIATSVRRISVVTAISPVAVLDMTIVLIENLRMLRRLASLYGGRPGLLGLMRLARMVLGHIVLTGGIALTDDVLRQIIGHGLTARLSARLGEGVLNGALTARVGIAAMDICRPLPFIEAKPPRLRSFLAEVLRRDNGGASAKR